MAEVAEKVREAIATAQMISTTMELMSSQTEVAKIPLGFTYGAMMSAVTGFADLAKMGAQMYFINRMKNEWVPSAANFPMQLCYEATRLDLEKLRGRVLERVNSDYDYLTYLWNAGLQMGMGASVSSFQEQFMASGQLRYAYGDLQYQTSILPRMRRFWMREYTPTIPDTRMAWTLFTRGDIPIGKFEEYASYEGWDKPNVDLLEKAMFKLPTDRTAFDMMLRGQLTIDEVHKKYYANAWKEEWHDKLDHLFTSYPSAGQAFSLFRRGVIKEDFMNSILKVNGFIFGLNQLLPKVFEKLPSAHDAFNMMMREAISEGDFDSYVEKDEWEDGSAAKLWAIYQHLPFGRNAFKLFRRGKIDAAKMTALFKAQGYMPSYQKILPNLFEHIFSVREAHTLQMRGYIDQKTYESYVYKNEWEDGSASLLDSLLQKLPSERVAFYMWAKGIIDTSQRDALYLAAGYTKEWHSKLTENNYYVPSVYDLTRIADFVEIDNIWATKVLKERGVRDRDITKILAMLKVRPLRDEIRRQIAIWVKRYRYGWVTPTQLDTALQEYVDDGWIQSSEKTFTVQEAELNWEDELMTEQIDIFKWYFKTALITDTDLHEDLLALGIREEKVNLMVEDLKAQGYYGYY